jgi:hypothetical protein
VLGQPVVAVGQLPPGRLRGPYVLDCRALGRGELGAGLLDRARVEHAGDPAVEVGEYDRLAEVDGLRVVDLVGERVLAREAAPVVRLGVVPLALHLATEHSAEHEAAEEVLALGSPGLADGRAVRACPTAGGPRCWDYSNAKGLVAAGVNQSIHVDRRGPGDE